MRTKLPLLLTCALPALLLNACNKAEEAATDAAANAPAAAEESTTDNAGPRISGAVAPGVAFVYRYAFSLPGEAIAATQQRHAAACQQLGTARCRITAMTYDQPREGKVQARIDFLLAPDIAHRFGSDGITAVEQAKGKLENAAIQGEDAGTAIKLSQQDSAAVEAEVRRIEERLSLGGLSKSERVDLRRQIAELRERLRGAAKDRSNKEASIASTPVSFEYSSEGLLGGNSFGKAAGASASSLGSILSLLVVLAGFALPWIGLAVLIGFGWRALRQRLGAASPTPSV